MQRHVKMIVALALAALPVAPAAAAEPGWTVRLHGAWSKPSIEASKGISAFPIEVSGKSSQGGGVGVEYRLRPWIGLGLDALRTRPDIVLDADLPGGRRRVSDGLGFTPFNLGPVFHLTPGRAVDLTVAATLGLAVFGDLRFAAEGQELNLEGGTNVAWGLGAAVDFHPGASKWALHAGVRRYSSTPEFTNRDNGAVGNAAFNPVVVTFGVAYRF